ncbi:MAG: excinuclease ABC subunit UvrB [Acidobacteria bacterium]|nr:excinuclease ABC subunit UvrB [Acidobacteriota bacterium]
MAGQFRLESDFAPCGDQPGAIEGLVTGLNRGDPLQVLMGVTGSGKTFTIAKVIETVNRPTLVVAHNKTLAAQLFQEFRSFFPRNAVEYFVSYYDYYQPEAYIPATDTYIAKEATVNEELDRMRLAATRSLFERRDVIIVASVSCIYGLGSPDAFYSMLLFLDRGQRIRRRELLRRLVELQYERSDLQFNRGTFRVRGDTVEVYPTYEDYPVRIELAGDEIEGLSLFDPLRGRVLETYERLSIYPRTHFVTPPDKLGPAIDGILKELEARKPELDAAGKKVEAQRLWERTLYDVEMLRQIGYCYGIENYSRHLDGRAPRTPPATLIDYLPADALLIIDESHQTVPQLRGMYEGDQSRKTTLVEFGFRLPSALDNRPLNFVELEQRMRQTICVSATPGPYELRRTGGAVVEQIIRPTGLMDPPIDVRPVATQVDDLLAEVRLRVERHERILVTTLTKRMAERLTDYYLEAGIRARYLHSDIDTLERVRILRDLRRGEFDVLVGVNLLREGLDLPEVSLVAILDADKEGFLRSSGSLIQTSGRAARNVNGSVIMYADTRTDSMRRAMEETERRRGIQRDYNQRNGITPETVRKAIQGELGRICGSDYVEIPERGAAESFETAEKRIERIKKLEAEMRKASMDLKFEEAANLRDQIKRLKTDSLVT